MQRVLGYLFFIALAVMAVVSLWDRARRAGTLNPFGERPDWLGIALIAAAAVSGVWLLVTREKRGQEQGSDGGQRDADESGTGTPGTGS